MARKTFESFVGKAVKVNVQIVKKHVLCTVDKQDPVVTEMQTLAIQKGIKLEFITPDSGMTADWKPERCRVFIHPCEKGIHRITSFKFG